MDRKLKGIPVYVIALMLVAGTVAGAGIWFLTVDVPVDYNEPVGITISSYRNEELQGYPDLNANLRLRDTNTHTQNANLVYNTYHQYVEITNPSGGIDNIQVTFEVGAYNATDGTFENEWIGFAILNGQVEPENISWSYSADDYRITAEEVTTGNSDTVVYDTTDEATTNQLTADGSSETFTVIYVLREYDNNGNTRDSVAPNFSPSNYEITWRFLEANV